MLRALVAAVAISMTTAADATVTFRTIARGTDSRVRTQHDLVARRAAPWHLVWYEHTGTHEPPEVDFAKEMVVGVFTGKRTGGDSVEIVSVTREGSLLVVRYREKTSAGSGADRATDTGTPFHIVAIPSDPSTVKFIAVTPS